MTLDLLIILVLVVINAAFAGTELAVVSLRRSQLLRLAEDKGRRGRVLLQLSEEPTRFLSTIQVGITLAGFLASATAAVSLAAPLEPALAFMGKWAGATALVLVTLVLTFFTLVFGELVPKRVAMRRPEQWALVAAPPVAFIARIASPLVWLLARSTDVTARMVGGGGSQPGSELMSDEQVLDVLASETSISPARRALVESVLELAERDVRDVLVPRRDVFTINDDATVAEAAQLLAGQGRSRAPLVTNSDLDEVVGILVLGTLVGCADQSALASTCATDPIVVPEGAHVQDVLGLMQRERRQLALVADEHGSTVGIVTMEDLLEEIVGELYDELDRDLSPTDPRGYQSNADGSFDLPGSFPVHDLPDLGLPEYGDSDAATVAGLLLDALERMPDVGDAATVGTIRITALAVTPTLVERVRVQRA